MIQDLIQKSRVIICSGAGGVGKTTTSAALGFIAAEMGRRCLVLTIDPARRLAGALGLTEPMGKAVQVPISGVSGSLHALMVDPRQVFLDFLDKTASSESAREGLLRNPLFQELISTLSGSQEFTSLEALLSATETQSYDLVILDTPPAQNAVDFLRAPERIFELFQDSVTNWFSMGAPKGLWSRLVHQGSTVVFQALETITGSAFLRELSDFFSQAASFQDKVSERSISAHRLLASESTLFVLVTVLDDAKIREAREFAVDLRTTGHHLGAAIINRAFPVWWSEQTDSSVIALAAEDELTQRLGRSWSAEVDFHNRRRARYRQILLEQVAGLRWVELPEFVEPVVGLHGLQSMARAILASGQGG